MNSAEITEVIRGDTRVGPASLITGPRAIPAFQERSALGSNGRRAENYSQAGI
jgi:hypothetical protein